MKSAALLALLVLAAPSCSQSEDVTGSTSSISGCAAEIYPSYDPKVFEQCVAVCKKCQNGVTTTCSTSCTLKGAR